MRKQRTHFDKAFKENAVKLSLERKNISDLLIKANLVVLLSLCEPVVPDCGQPFKTKNY